MMTIGELEDNVFVREFLNRNSKKIKADTELKYDLLTLIQNIREFDGDAYERGFDDGQHH